MIEAIVTIFRDLDLNLTPSFDYELDYKIREHAISIKTTAGIAPMIMVDGESKDPWEVSDTYRENPTTGEAERGSARRYLPSNVFYLLLGKK